jgi:hypothetical protein
LLRDTDGEQDARIAAPTPAETRKPTVVDVAPMIGPISSGDTNWPANTRAGNDVSTMPAPPAIP